ncbi:MAG: hybrid sensor histidine kinase/response regulator [Saprospiraceae bacterium]|nr:MAG: hybrid sensor histidine kinase/response regulator [Saprospiraceae bacterium]
MVNNCKTTYYIVIALLFLLVVCPWGNAQDNYIKFDRITPEHGLPQDHVFCILQDRKGFLWLGQETGLVRYDGYSFKVYQHDPGNPHSISGNIIKALHEDGNGDLWVGTDGGGLCRFDPRTEKFEIFKHDPEVPNTISGNRVYAISEDKSGAIWAATLGNGLNKFVFDQPDEKQPSKYKVTRYKFNPDDPTSLADNNIWTMMIDQSERLWVGTVTGGLNMLDLKTLGAGKAGFKRFQHDTSDPTSLSGNSVKSIYEDQSGELWVGTEFNGLNRLLKGSEQFQRYVYQKGNIKSLSHNYVSSVFEDRDNRLWVATNGGGLCLFDRSREGFTRYRHVAGDPYSLNSDLINTIYQDQIGVIWIGLVINGMNSIDPQKQQIKHYYQIEGDPYSLNGNLVKTIYEDKKGQIWIGTFGGGLSLFDIKTGRFTHLLQKSDTSNNTSNNNVQVIYEDSQGKLWIGTDGAGLHQYDQQKNSFSSFNHSPSGATSLSGNGVWSICEDIRGNLWIGTAGGGVNKFDKDTQEFIHFKNNPADPNSISSNDVRAIFEDHLGILWIGTYGGLNRYNPANNQFFQYKNLAGDSTSISNDIITSIFESPTTKQLWIGTFGGGLNRFDRVTESFKSYQKKDGLPNSVVKSIEEDGKGNLWISTLKGICQFNPVHETFVNYSIIDGLQGEGFNLGSSCLTKDKVMLFGGTNGFNVFFPENPEKVQDENPPCLITDLRIFNRSIQPGEWINKHQILPQSIHEVKEITIPYHIDDFAFEFAALDFARSGEIKYAYQLEGYDETWQNSDATRRYASYSNLPAGDYTFKVRANNKDGSWSGQATQLNVKVLNTPWKSWWAYTLYFFMLMGFIYLIRHYEIGRIKLINELRLERLEQKRVRELNEMKLKFFTNISHEIRTPLTLIISPLESLRSSFIGNNETREQLQIMHRNANRLLRLINQLLEFREQEAGHMKLKVAKGNFSKFVHEISLSFSDITHQKNIDFSLECEPKVIELWYDRSQMEKVLFNLLSNAIKFTPEYGKISVKVKALEESIQLIVEDNGNGISNKDLPFIFDRFYKFDKDYSGNYLGSGIGLALTKNLVELHHGNITVESKPKEYTRFVVELKSGSAHFSEDQINSDFKSSEDARHYQLNEIEPAAGPFMASKPQKKQGPKVLIVEDNEDVRNYLKNIFASTYQISEASDGKKGLKLANEILPDLIISDIMMPELDGIELCRVIKTTIETSHIPVVLLTARTSVMSLSKGLDTGADDYITKPFNPGLLKKRVHNLIESRRILREKFSNELKIEPSEVTLTSPDQQLLKKAIEAVEKHLSDETFDVNTLAKEIGLSRPVLYRKFPAITNYTPNGFIRVMRLKRAAQLLSQNVVSVSEICYSTGFKTPKYFSKCFREEFGVNPSDYARNPPPQT